MNGTDDFKRRPSPVIEQIWNRLEALAECCPPEMAHAAARELDATIDRTCPSLGADAREFYRTELTHRIEKAASEPKPHR